MGDDEEVSKPKGTDKSKGKDKSKGADKAKGSQLSATKSVEGAKNFITTLFPFLKPDTKKVAKEKKIKREILKRQKVLDKKEICQKWRIVFGNEVPAYRRDVHVINNITTRNIWMEEFFIFNHIRALFPNEFFHPPETYALKWQPPDSLFQLLLPMHDPKVQENAVLVMSKMTNRERKRTIFFFAPITPSVPMFAVRVHPASLVSYRTKNQVIKKLDDFYIQGKITTEDFQQIFLCNFDVWSSALYNLLPEDEQVYHTYLNEKKMPLGVSHKEINKSYLEGEITLKEYDELKFPERKAKNDIVAMKYPLPYEGVLCIICNKEGCGVIKCQNCTNMVCVPCMLKTFNTSAGSTDTGAMATAAADDEAKEQEDGEGKEEVSAFAKLAAAVSSHSKQHTSAAESPSNEGSFLLLHQTYCMKLGKLQDIHLPLVSEPAYLRTFRATSKVTAIKILNQFKTKREETFEDYNAEDEEEKAYREMMEQQAKEREAELQRRLAIENPPELMELRVKLNERKKRFGKFEKDLLAYREKINDTSHTDMFIARNVRLFEELLLKMNHSITEPVKALKLEGQKLNLYGDYIDSFIREADRLLDQIEQLNRKDESSEEPPAAEAATES